MMEQSGQLNIHSYKNRHSRQVRSVALFGHNEMHADLVLVPPKEAVAWKMDAEHDTLFDVVEGNGTFEVDACRFAGGPGKCVFVPAGTRHRLTAAEDVTWVLRVTRIEQVKPRHMLRVLRRTLWDKLGLSA
jgi:mannose-6-phosphate isomerase-like protein (cupin superfamily)